MRRTTDFFPKKYIMIDLETSGFNVQTDEIIEIGAIKYDDGMEIDRLSLLIKPRKPISKKIESLTGITNELLDREGKERYEAIKTFYDFIENEIIIGHNITSFDNRFIEKAFCDELNCKFNNDFLDTLYLARKKRCDLEHHSLKALSEEYNIDYSKAHRAIEDCIINNFIYELLAFDSILSSKEYIEFQSGCEQLTPKVQLNEELETLNCSELIGWKKKVTEALEKMNSEKQLPENSICIKVNKGKDKETTTSFSICIYEPDLIEDTKNREQYTIVTRITEGKLKSKPSVLTIEPKNQNELNIVTLPSDAILYEPKKTNSYVRIDQNSENLVSYLISSVEYALENYVPKASSFACCSRYFECSNAKQCIHPNQLYSKACKYRKNLEKGNNFLIRKKEIGNYS